MGLWKDRTIILGVTGSIAAYKACDLASQLTKDGARVHVIMTSSATHLVGPQTFRELTRQPVRVEMFNDGGWEPVVHVSLAQSADLLLVAPATANVLGKVSAGIADDLLTTTIMATKAPVIFAPAMNDQMWANPIVQENVTRLRGLGYRFVSPESGHLLCGSEGQGRLASREAILAAVGEALNRQTDLKGRHILVTAGPTREPIDPVRYISNRSSGRMGFALAEAAQRRGAAVTLVSGPVSIEPPSGVELVRIETTAEMANEVLARAGTCDVVIKAAAPADFTPGTTSRHKIKKSAGSLSLDLEPTLDILSELGRQRRPGQVIVGFAAETDNLVAYAQDKLTRKNLDLVVANDVTRPGAGFDVESNVVVMVTPDGIEELPLLSKSEVADRILDRVVRLLSR